LWTKEANMNSQFPASGTAGATESIATRSGVKLLIEKRADERQIDVLLRAQTGRRCVLHWGVREKNQAGWQILPQSSWPEGTTTPAGFSAMQTPFRKQNGESGVAIALNPDAPYGFIEFVLFFPDDGRWDNNDNRNYQIVVPAAEGSGTTPLSALKAQFGQEEVVLERVFEVEDLGHLAAGVTKADTHYRVLLMADIPGPLSLHWGIARRSPYEWVQPPEPLRPPGTILLQDGHTAQTPFAPADGLQRLAWELPEQDAPLGIQFVLKQGEDGRWLKQRGGNFYIPVHSAARPATLPDATELAGLAGQISSAKETDLASLLADKLKNVSFFNTPETR